MTKHTLLATAVLALLTTAEEVNLATVRLTVNVTFDLHGESSETARIILMRMVDQAILAGPPAGQTDVVVVHHGFELSAVMSGERLRSTDTDFSQLLNI